MPVTIRAVVRKDRMDILGNVPIMIRITVDKQHSYQQIGERIPLKMWTDSGRVSDRLKNASLINAKIDKRIAELRSRFLREELDDRAVTSEVVKGVLSKMPKANYDVYSYMEKLADEKWLGIKAPGTIRQMRGEIGKLRMFRKNLKFEEITPEWLSAYEYHMRKNLHNKQNTVWKSLKILRTIVNEARRDGITEKYAFNSFKLPRQKPGDRPHLSVAEIKRFEEVVFDGERTPGDYIVGLFFLFSCYTGLRYADCEKFRSKLHIQNSKRILLNMSKTDDSVSLIITPVIKRALSEILPYEGKLPTNQECNRALKVIAEKAKIKKNLTFHCARHTFGYTCAENNVPIEITQKLMGHRSAKVTQIYYHISNSNVDQWMLKLHATE